VEILETSRGFGYIVGKNSGGDRQYRKVGEGPKIKNQHQGGRRAEQIVKYTQWYIRNADWGERKNQVN